MARALRGIVSTFHPEEFYWVPYTGFCLSVWTSLFLRGIYGDFLGGGEEKDIKHCGEPKFHPRSCQCTDKHPGPGIASESRSESPIKSN